MILYLDNFPRGKKERILTTIKIFIKEGLLYQNWKEVFKNRSTGGSVSIPKLVREGLPTVMDNLLINEFRVENTNHIHVFKDVRALEWALEKKRHNDSLKVTAGPFIVNHPSERNHLIESEKIDGLVFFSQWHQDMFCHFSEQVRQQHNYTWFCGVDTNDWKPKKNQSITDSKNNESILVYSKTNPNISQQVIHTLNSKGYDCIEIVCGSYSKSEYKAALERCSMAVFVSVTETQGLAIFEAWSMNVPTFHFNPGVWNYHGHQYNRASSCPYLENALGAEFKNMEEFEPNFIKLANRLGELSPRDIVLKKYTIQHSLIALKKILS